MDEFYRISETIKDDKPLSYKVLSIVTCLLSALYYISDNILWVFSVLIKSKILNKGREVDIKHNKNLFSFYRVISYIMTLLFDLKLKSDQIRITKANITNQKNIGKTEPKTSLITIRRKVRFIQMELFLSLLRVAMLTQTLKLPGYEYFDPIVISLCGLISSAMALFKAIFEKDIVVNVQRDHSVAQKDYQ